MRAAILVIVAGVFVAAAGAASGPPSGSYTATITGKPAALNGRWRLDFRAAGAVNIVRNGAVVVRGTALPLSGARVKLHDRSGPYACSKAEGDGTYRYRLTGSRVTFTALSDRCVGRTLVLTTKPYTRQG
jgi:hypothetical protein